MASNSDIAHAWAHNQDRAHNGSNFRHEYGRLYSYSTCIGQRIELDGNVIFLLNTHNYSHSTCKHQGYMNGAIPEGDNIYSFCVDGTYCYGSWLIHDCREYNMDGWRLNLIRLGLNFLADSYEVCKGIKTCKQLDCGFSRKGYNEMLRWFKVTKCATLNKVLRMKDDDFKRISPAPKRFVRALSEDKPLERICDLINGKGVWEAYQKRTEGLRLAQRNRAWSRRLFFRTPQNAYRTYWTGYQHGRHAIVPVVDGSVTQKDIMKHTKAGDLIQWFYKLYKENYAAAVRYKEACDRHDRMEDAKKRLERFIGLSGFQRKWYPYPINEERTWFTSFDYNGTVIDFTGRNGYRESGLNADEYTAFTKMGRDEQRAFIVQKRQWMLERLQADNAEWQRQEAERDEWHRRYEAESREYAEKVAANREHIEEQKARGDEGLRQLYHEGYKVQLPWSGNAPVFLGGNVLLRLNQEKNLIETSKQIRLSVDEARRLWVFVSRCHETGGDGVKGFVIHTQHSNYTVHSYQNDILTAGCHQIAYPEMAYIAKQLNLTV